MSRFLVFLFFTPLMEDGLAEYYNFLPQRIPSLTPYSALDIDETLGLPERLPLLKRKFLTLKIISVSDYPEYWRGRSYRDIIKLASYYLRDCRIKLKATPLYYFARGGFHRKGGLIKRRFSWLFFRRLGKKREQLLDSTLVFFTDKVAYRYRVKGKFEVRRFLGLSSQIWIIRGEERFLRPAIWLRPSLVYTVLVHELGHRLGLPHIPRPYSLMLTGPLIRRSFPLALSALWGFFDPELLYFSENECKIMYKKLFFEIKKMVQPRKRGS